MISTVKVVNTLLVKMYKYTIFVKDHVGLQVSLLKDLDHALTYLVQVNTGVFWRRHVDHLRAAPDKPPEQNKTVPSPSPDFPSPSDFIPIVDSEQSSVEQRAEQPSTERRYPRRLNRRPPTRYCN